MQTVTHVRCERPIQGDWWPAIERLIHEPDEWLPTPAQPLGEGRWRAGVHAGGVHRFVTLTLGTLRTLPDAFIRTLSWTPESWEASVGSRVLPDFHGQVELRETDEGLRLVLHGHYEPPGGKVGAVLDRAGAHRVADATLANLAEEIARRLDPA